MSWFDRSEASRPRRRVAAAIILCGVGLLLSGCGFRPLYATPDDSEAGPAGQMASIYVAPLRDRTGHILHNLLRNRLNPGGMPAESLYVLDVQLTESIEQLAIRQDETATRANLRLAVEYSLRQRATDEVVMKGHSLTITTYNILRSQFATYTSEEDARKRALRELSDDIRIQIAAYFNRVDDGAS